jgi:Protein of unknown function (DUF1580)
MENVLDNRDVLTFAEAARELPGKPSPCTLWRWRSRGIRGVKLKTVLRGGRRFVSRQQLADFIEATTNRGAARDEPVRNAGATTERLQEAGLL